LEAINRFQQQHPDGIVVVIAYSYGAQSFAQGIAGRTRRPVDIGVFFDPYNEDGADLELPQGSVRYGFNFYQQNETTSSWYDPFGGDNPFGGSRVTNAEFENFDLTGQVAKRRRDAKIGHNSIVHDVMYEDRYKQKLNHALRR
jgi:hypothetical protein